MTLTREEFATLRAAMAERELSDDELSALAPYQVDNAVIMAAGMSERFAPISYEKPKGLLRVRGEVLIERQIRQLHEAGITDITVVVGYKGEYFFYLAAEFGVSIMVNPVYATRNNHSTLWAARARLGNTFVCSSDNYFAENPFERYVYEAYYATRYVEGDTDEWCVTTGDDEVITEVTVGGRDAWVMLGHVYFDRAFSATFRRILEEEYDLPTTAPKLWESLYLDHIDELRMIARRYPSTAIHEFDSLDELRGFDDTFIENVDSEALDNIAATLGCAKTEISDFYPLKQGITNLSCHFSVDGAEYVYRHPGVGTEKMIDRKAEVKALKLARRLGLDSTFLHADPKRGWKISRFLPDVRTLDPQDPGQLRAAMRMDRLLHESGKKLKRRFDFFDEGEAYERLLASHGPIDVPGYFELKEKVIRLKRHADADGYPQVPSHNDFFPQNLLIDAGGDIHLIDWEYAGMSDIANDFGTFVVCSQLPLDAASEALDAYFGRPATPAERRHFFAYIVLAGWCWYVWALAKEAEGDNVGEWLYIYYVHAAHHVDRVLAWYEQPSGDWFEDLSGQAASTKGVTA
ncbi:MAG: phosphotransferase [Propioniciclava sp.]|uniref:phosphotransferase n=1 Tax=Propioniciclava sp. TaxID=2038686 RepID=UPI0039E25252